MIATLAAIHIHPVKSCAPLALETATVEARGLAHDRRYLVVDADGRFLTGRQLPRLTLLRALPVAGGLALRAPGMPAHAVAAPDGKSVIMSWNRGAGMAGSFARAYGLVCT